MQCDIFQNSAPLLKYWIILLWSHLLLWNWRFLISAYISWVLMETGVDQEMLLAWCLSGEYLCNILIHWMFGFLLGQVTGIIECCVWEEDGPLFGGVFLISPSCIVPTSSGICGWRKTMRSKNTIWVPLKVQVYAAKTCKCLIFIDKCLTISFVKLATYLPHHKWWSYYSASEQS